MIHVIMVAYERYIELEIAIRSFLIQTKPDWTLHIVYDGTAPEGIIDIVRPFLSGERKDDRIHFYQSPERYQRFGHPNRRTMIQSIKCEPKDFILNTNEDNYYVPLFVEYMLSVVTHKTGIVYCNTVHSHMKYDINSSELRENCIDIGAFMVRADISKETGFNYDYFSADGTYAEECNEACKKKGLLTVKINKPLFIHN